MPIQRELGLPRLALLLPVAEQPRVGKSLEPVQEAQQKVSLPQVAHSQELAPMRYFPTAGSTSRQHPSQQRPPGRQSTCPYRRQIENHQQPALELARPSLAPTWQPQQQQRLWLEPALQALLCLRRQGRWLASFQRLLW